MDISVYKETNKWILENLPSDETYLKYIRLMEIFIMDCALPIKQKEFGNITKNKAAILFRLQEQFLNYKHVVLFPENHEIKNKNEMCSKRLWQYRIQKTLWKGFMQTSSQTV